MKQRLAIAQAIMESPELLLLDEPTNALDESGVTEVRALIANERARGATVILASHNREDIEQLCDRVYIMRAGTLSEREDG
jgi:ABC-2 type transport system ATP-binding protein